MPKLCKNWGNKKQIEKKTIFTKNETIFLVAQIALDFISSDNIKSTKLKSYVIVASPIMKL